MPNHIGIVSSAVVIHYINARSTIEAPSPKAVHRATRILQQKQSPAFQLPILQLSPAIPYLPLKKGKFFYFGKSKLGKNASYDFPIDSKSSQVFFILTLISPKCNLFRPHISLKFDNFVLTWQNFDLSLQFYMQFKLFPLLFL